MISGPCGSEGSLSLFTSLPVIVYLDKTRCCFWQLSLQHANVCDSPTIYQCVDIRQNGETQVLKALHGHQVLKISGSFTFS